MIALEGEAWLTSQSRSAAAPPTAARGVVTYLTRGPASRAASARSSSAAESAGGARGRADGGPVDA
jgi:hypothetical protein